MGSSTQHLGEHDLRVEDNVIFVRWNGDFRTEHVGALFQCIESLLSVHEQVFAVLDARAAGRIEPDARRLAIAHVLPRDFSGVAIFGASLSVTVLLNVLIKALHLVRGIALPVHFASTEEAAHAWIAAERRRVRDG